MTGRRSYTRFSNNSGLAVQRPCLLIIAESAIALAIILINLSCPKYCIANHVAYQTDIISLTDSVK